MKPCIQFTGTLQKTVAAVRLRKNLLGELREQPRYDLTVRTSNSDVVQFAFGDAAATDLHGLAGLYLEILVDYKHHKL